MTPLALGLLAGLASACQGGLDEPGSALGVAEQPIYYGTRAPTVTNLTSGEEQAIGYLADSSGSPFCTATLIDRDVAVTARHCVVDTVAVDDMRFGMGDPAAPSALVPVHSAPYHSTMDVALLLLKQDAVAQVPGAEPIPFLRESPSTSWIGTAVEAAGYGATHDDSTGRYYAQVELEDIESDFIVVNGNGQRGICFGDSGGPLFVHVGDGEPVIAGIESHGDASCVDQDFETRLDVAATWIDAEMGSFDPQSSPQTGPQTDGDGECVPAVAGIDNLETGQSNKCFDGFPLCSASPTTNVANPFVVALALAGIALALNRRRRLARRALRSGR